MFDDTILFDILYYTTHTFIPVVVKFGTLSYFHVKTTQSDNICFRLSQSTFVDGLYRPNPSSTTPHNKILKL